MIGNKKHYLIAGATGLIGKQLLNLLLQHPETGKVTVLARRNLEIEDAKLHVSIKDFEELTERDIPSNVDAVFCCLGTTMALARSKDAFRKVDFEYVAKLGVFSQRQKIKQYHVVSAQGANPTSFVFYNKVKGRMEKEVEKLTKIRSIYFYRPSLLLGDRKEMRYAESIGKFFMKNFAFLIPKRSKAIYDLQVAMAMRDKALNPDKGIHVVSNAEMIDHSK